MGEVNESISSIRVNTSSAQPKNEFLYKILVIGEPGTGKTSFIKRYVHQFFSQHYRATIGVDFALKIVDWDPQTVIRLQLWDIAGQERFGNMTRVYYKGAVGAFVVFDVTRSDTFAAVEKWKNDLDSKVLLPDGRTVPCILIGNKCDALSTATSTAGESAAFRDRSTMNRFCKDKGFSGWFFSSAKDNINVDESAKFLVQKIIDNDKWSPRGARVRENNSNSSNNNSNGNNVTMKLHSKDSETSQGKPNGRCSC